MNEMEAMQKVVIRGLKKGGGAFLKKLCMKRVGNEAVIGTQIYSRHFCRFHLPTPCGTTMLYSFCQLTL
jgi:hypothetical protein